MSASPTDKNEPTHVEEAPRRKSSKIARKEDPNRSPDANVDEAPPKRTKSMLERLGIANADLIGPAARPFEEGELPQRSPEGTIRAHGGSKLVRRDLSKVGKQTVEKENAKAADETVVPTGPQWHVMPLEEFLTALNTRAGGLTQQEALAALQKHGKNEITPPPKQSVFVKLLLNLISPFSLIMIVCGILAFAIVGYNTGTTGDVDKQNVALGVVLIAVAVIVGIFQTAMENSADNLMEALHSLTAESAWVLRDNKLVQIAASQLVPGDVVRVQLGEKVPADLRIIEASDLKVNNAPLTGETIDIRLGPDANDHRLFEAKNIARSGCNFTSGNGLGVIFATGDNTFFGTIAKAATTAEKPDTLMRREVKRLILMMASIGIVMSIAFFIATMVLYKSLIKAFIIVVGLFTANVPEGLLPQITVALTITARRMFERKVIVANLEIIETLGAVSVICSDKTGTLTLNRMTVSHLVLDGQIVMNQFSPILQGDNVIMLDPASTPWQAVQRIICLNSDAMFIKREPAADPFAWDVKGDASETALVKFAQSHTDVDAVRAAHRRLAVVPFSSKKKWMAAVHQLGPNRQLVMLKGAAERVISRCKTMLTSQGEVPLTAERRAELDAILLNLARRAERVFAFAHLEINMPDDFEFVVDGDMTNFPLENLTLCGMASMVDPPRPSVPGAIKSCHRAGIHVIMVTGDHPETAVAISRSLGLITLPLIHEAGPNADPDKHAIVVTGDDLARMSAMEPNKKEAEWDRVLACREHVFARTQPEQKQDLVRALQSRGQVVAMTGDGVNDSPALKAANVGVAVGSGTSVAKEAAQIIILDDDFNSIVVGVREGRMIFDNLKKAITYIVAHLTPELLPFILNFALKIPLAMETITILLVDLGTDMLPGIALAYEEAEDRIMALPPRTADDHMVQPRMLLLGYVFTGVIEAFFAFWSYYYVWYAHGYDFNSIRGTETGYHDPWDRQDAENQAAFRAMCTRSRDWHGGCTTDAEMTEFMPWFNTLVGKACAAYFITMAIMQWAHVLTRRNQTMSMFDPRQSVNWRLFVAIAFSVAFACFFVYVPGVNAAFFLAAVNSGQAISGMWGVAVLIGIDELRKWACRRWPTGVIARYTLY